MNTHNKLTSLRKFLFTRILGVTTLLLLSISFSIIYIVEAEQMRTLEKNTRDWANHIAQESAYYLIKNTEEARRLADEDLNVLLTSDFINYVHIYKKNDNETTFFTGYNKSIYFPAIPDKSTHLEELLTLKHQKNNIELAVKITHSTKLLGYVYIQTSKQYINDFNRKSILIGVFLFVLSFIIYLILAYVLNHKINHGIMTIVDSIQDIAHSKNYNSPIANQPLIELDFLAQNINILLNITLKHIKTKDEKHHQALSQNNKLTQKVQARTDALKTSNQELLATLEKLHQFQGQLVETKKMASLGDMVAGVAHEINTPIGLGVTASTLFSDRLLEIKNAFDDKTLKSSQLKSFLYDGEENINIICRNLDRAAQLITNFKKVAVDQSDVNTQALNVKTLLKHTSLTLKSKLTNHHIKLVIDCPENLVINSNPGAITQVFINLILNSIIHGFEDIPDGEINISVLYLNDQLHIHYQDNGIGINENIKDKVFEPFTTTKRGSGGSGLGLHLVYNIVTQALNGHIDLESEPHLGTKFNIIFPAPIVTNE